MDKIAKLRDRIIRDIIINIDEFTKAKFVLTDHIDGIDPTSTSDKETLHPWPNQYAIDRFHRSNKQEYLDELKYHNIDVLDNQFVFLYFADEYIDGDYEPNEQLGYLRFTYLKHYYIIHRLIHWAKNNIPVNIHLEYHGELFPNPFNTPRIISNTPLLDYLVNHDHSSNMRWKVSMRDNPKEYVEVDYFLTELAFIDLGLYFDTPFTVNRLDTPIKRQKNKAYILTEDKQLYQNIADKSYINFIQLRDDKEFIEKVAEHYNKYSI